MIGFVQSVYPYRYYLFLSLLIKIALALYYFEFGFLVDDFTVIVSDGKGFVVRGVEENFAITLTSHWMYNYCNSLAFSIAGSQIGTYWMMVVSNISLSFGALYYLHQIVCQLFDSHIKRRLKYIYILFLFWPTATWLATQNLKDMMLSVIVLATFNLILRFLDKYERSELIDAGYYGLFLVGMFFLISTFRTYLAMLLCVVFVLYFLIKYFSFRTLLLIVVALALVQSTSVWELLYGVSFLGNHWLFNPSLLEEMNQSLIAQGRSAVFINTDFGSVFRAVIKVAAMPFVSINIESVTQLLLGIESLLFNSLIFIFFFTGRLRCKHKALVFGIIILSLIMYGFLERFAGPRQLFPVWDQFFILLTGAMAAESAKLLATSFVIGLALSLISLHFTAKIIFFT
jgi:hypothetical protein